MDPDVARHARRKFYCYLVYTSCARGFCISPYCPQCWGKGLPSFGGWLGISPHLLFKLNILIFLKIFTLYKKKFTWFWVGEGLKKLLRHHMINERPPMRKLSWEDMICTAPLLFRLNTLNLLWICQLQINSGTFIT